MSDEDDLTLVPVYRFEWDNGITRETSDPSFTTAANVSPDAVEELAAIARDDPECNVSLIGMGS